MITLLLIALLNAFVIIGFYLATQYETEKDYYENTKRIKDKMILWFIGYYGDKYLPKLLRKPLYDCIPCMASIHSVYVYWLFMDWTLLNLYAYPIYILALSGITFFIYNLIPE